MSTRLQSLPEIEHACWAALSEAAHDRYHDWHHLVLATVNGNAADARTVILRDVDLEAQRLVFYTDDRSPKVAQMRAHPRGTLVAWSPRASWQLRLQVTLAVADDGLDVSSRWARVKLSPGAQDYLAALPPGTPVSEFTPERESREHFAVVTAQVDAIDWLELDPAGHRRARFERGSRGWLTP
jgi:hypothetical protein